MPRHTQPIVSTVLTAQPMNRVSDGNRFVSSNRAARVRREMTLVELRAVCVAANAGSGQR